MLTRVIALSIADGDAEKAEEIIKWASKGQGAEVEKKPRDATSSFIKRYLTPYAPYDKEKIERFIGRVIVKTPENIDFQVVKNTVSNMPYSDFLNTVYWRGVSLFIKRRDGFKCASCGSTEKIEVHHKTYENHGDEIHNLADLTTLCEKCHRDEHSAKEEPKEEQNNPPVTTQGVRRVPKVGSALSMAAIINKNNDRPPRRPSIRAGWGRMIEGYSRQEKFHSLLSKSKLDIEDVAGKRIVTFFVDKYMIKQWIEDKYLREMECALKEATRDQNIELRVKSEQTREEFMRQRRK